MYLRREAADRKIQQVSPLRHDTSVQMSSNQTEGHHACRQHQNYCFSVFRLLAHPQLFAWALFSRCTEAFPISGSSKLSTLSPLDPVGEEYSSEISSSFFTFGLAWWSWDGVAVLGSTACRELNGDSVNCDLGPKAVVVESRRSISLIKQLDSHDFCHTTGPRDPFEFPTASTEYTAFDLCRNIRKRQPLLSIGSNTGFQA